jgi:hypothetical protein
MPPWSDAAQRELTFTSQHEMHIKGDNEVQHSLTLLIQMSVLVFTVKGWMGWLWVI